MATTSESGWPYVQHRGGPRGFLRAIDDATLAFADFRGNRQYHQRRQSGGQRPSRADPDGLPRSPPPEDLRPYRGKRASPTKSDLAAKLHMPGYNAMPERALLLHLEAFDWNCPQHITPRFTESELAAALDQVRSRIEALELENAVLRAEIVKKDGTT